MAQEANKGIVERGAAFFEKLHYGLGAVALVGAEVLSSGPLFVFGAWEVAHGALWTWLKNHSKQKQMKPSHGT
jgi:hypothetical protein